MLIKKPILWIGKSGGQHSICNCVVQTSAKLPHVKLKRYKSLKKLNFFCWNISKFFDFVKNRLPRYAPTLQKSNQKSKVPHTDCNLYFDVICNNVFDKKRTPISVGTARQSKMGKHTETCPAAPPHWSSLFFKIARVILKNGNLTLN